MADRAIEVEHLTKVYRLYRSPKDRLRELLSLSGKKYHHEFHALRDVSFAIQKGETVGIIGQNGSGKSTLLKIICGVLRATKGSVKVNGRVSSLLELGAGFHPEFTGRDNVYMNGALMGLSRDEIEKRFAEIEAFADIGEYIDQPVKTYSSGMFVRLAFAAAVGVDPEILVIDEALAVGDARFQMKCMKRMEEFRSKGQTIVLVSHNLYSIRAFCTACLWIQHGELAASGNPDEVVNRYLSSSVAAGDQSRASSVPKETAEGAVRITGARLLDRTGNESRAFRTGDDITLEVFYFARDKVVRPTFGYSVCASSEKLEQVMTAPNSPKRGEMRVCSYSTKWDGSSPEYIFGSGTVRVFLKNIPLLPGHYRMLFAIRDEFDLLAYDTQEKLIGFDILEGDDRSGILGTCGLVYYPTGWEFLAESSEQTEK